MFEKRFIGPSLVAEETKAQKWARMLSKDEDIRRRLAKAYRRDDPFFIAKRIVGIHRCMSKNIHSIHPSKLIIPPDIKSSSDRQALVALCDIYGLDYELISVEHE